MSFLSLPPSPSTTTFLSSCKINTNLFPFFFLFFLSSPLVQPFDRFTSNHGSKQGGVLFGMPVAVGAASVFTTRKVAAYGVLSTLAAFAVVLSAFRQRSNFYSAAVMLGRSNGCMMVRHPLVFPFGLFNSLILPFLSSLGAFQFWTLLVPVLWQDVSKGLLWAPSRCGS